MGLRFCQAKGRTTAEEKIRERRFAHNRKAFVSGNMLRAARHPCRAALLRDHLK